VCSSDLLECGTFMVGAGLMGWLIFTVFSRDIAELNL